MKLTSYKDFVKNIKLINTPKFNDKSYLEHTVSGLLNLSFKQNDEDETNFFNSFFIHNSNEALFVLNDDITKEFMQDKGINALCAHTYNCFDLADVNNLIRFFNNDKEDDIAVDITENNTLLCKSQTNTKKFKVLLDNANPYFNFNLFFNAIKDTYNAMPFLSFDRDELKKIIDLSSPLIQGQYSNLLHFCKDRDGKSLNLHYIETSKVMSYKFKSQINIDIANKDYEIFSLRLEHMQGLLNIIDKYSDGENPKVYLWWFKTLGVFNIASTNIFYIVPLCHSNCAHVQKLYENPDLNNQFLALELGDVIHLSELSYLLNGGIKKDQENILYIDLTAQDQDKVTIDINKNFSSLDYTIKGEWNTEVNENLSACVLPDFFKIFSMIKKYDIELETVEFKIIADQENHIKIMFFENDEIKYMFSLLSNRKSSN